MTRADKIIYNGQLIDPPDGVRVSNMYASHVKPFAIKGTIKEHKNIVSHENAGSIRLDTLQNFLNSKKGGYHFIVEPFRGFVSQHADLSHKLWHGNRANGYGIGFCFINPYYPHLLDTDLEISTYKVMPSQWWTHGKDGYCVPTNAQITTAIKLLPWLCNLLGIPYEFPTLNTRKKIEPWQKIPPGIIAHRDYRLGRSDGRYMIERVANARDICYQCGQTTPKTLQS